MKMSLNFQIYTRRSGVSIHYIRRLARSIGRLDMRRCRSHPKIASGPARQRIESEFQNAKKTVQEDGL